MNLVLSHQTRTHKDASESVGCSGALKSLTSALARRRVPVVGGRSRGLKKMSFSWSINDKSVIKQTSTQVCRRVEPTVVASWRLLRHHPSSSAIDQRRFLTAACLGPLLSLKALSTEHVSVFRQVVSTAENPPSALELTKALSDVSATRPEEQDWSNALGSGSRGEQNSGGKKQ